MKKFRLLSVIMLVFAFVGLVSCENEPLDNNLLNNPQSGGGGGGTTNGPAVFKVDIDGQPFVATTTMATVGGGLTSIAGIKTATGQTVTMTVQATTTGTFNNVVMTYDASPTDEYGYANFNLSTGQISGTVTISSINTTARTLSGTFSFTGWYSDTSAGVAPVNLTNGVFTNIPYTTGVPSEDEESLKATVDGTTIDYVDDIVVTYSGPGQYITIGGVGSDHIINVIIKDDLTVGTHQILPSPTSPARARYINDADEDFTAQNGVLTIESKTSTRIKGSFSFVTNPEAPEPAHTVTNGTFDIVYN